MTTALRYCLRRLLLLLVTMLLVSLLAFLAFGRDKALARQGRFRIPEARLLLYAALGGSAGAWLGMRRFHHKTKKWRFRITIPALFLT